MMEVWSEWRDSNSRPLPPEGEEAVTLRSECLVLLGLRSLGIAADHLKRCGIVAKSVSTRLAWTPPWMPSMPTE